MFGIRKKREVARELEITRQHNKEIDEAQETLAKPEDLLKYLEQKFPDTIPPHEVNSWEVGVLKGRQDVIRDLKHLVNLANS